MRQERLLRTPSLFQPGLIGSAILFSLLGTSPSTLASEADSAVAASSKPCSAPEHRQFDFWIGNWEVHTPDGQLAGTNRIASILGGCALEERWTGAGGMEGRSFNIYSAADRKWHQTWVDGFGRLLELSGGMEKGMMVLSGESRQTDGTRVHERITWETMDDGRVRQTWNRSTDGGKSWKAIFTGLYSRMK